MIEPESLTKSKLHKESICQGCRYIKQNCDTETMKRVMQSKKGKKMEWKYYIAYCNRRKNG